MKKETVDCIWFDLESGKKEAQFFYKCTNSEMFVMLEGQWGNSHTCIKVDIDVLDKEDAIIVAKELNILK